MTAKPTFQSHQPAKKKFQKRYYDSWPKLRDDLKYIFSHREQIKIAMSSPELDLAFRERLMLAVTEVNRCRYCRAFHVGQARQAGISNQEIALYLKGTIPDEVPEHQKLAVCFARHWAETDTHPDQDFVDQVRETYGDEGFQNINLVLRMIRMGNLLGNTLDKILFFLSFGLLGR
jgi:AhpD family alkylhydroperoxidase